MASIFTFDPDPPRVSSPWLTPPISVPNPRAKNGSSDLEDVGMPPAALLIDCGISKLEAEPQEGPTEYKLHLLLRPRRSFSASTTVQHVSGSYQSKTRIPPSDTEFKASPAKLAPASTPSNQSRQNRLQHLTTQLLWRLQQSSPYHSSSKADLVVPVLPEFAGGFPASAPNDTGRLPPGIEGSQGALYEIGVSDDGTLVGLTKDELEESLQNLRAMASSLGCKVKVLRMVIVGSCQWIEDPQPKGSQRNTFREENLWVAEALVIPNLEPQVRNTDLSSVDFSSASHPIDETDFAGAEQKETVSRTEQLRVSLTGSTTSGKSSLLGTLSTSTFDNGRGKSRLSLLKHRHEISTGATSSVTPELIGYHEANSDGNAIGSHTDVVNYASGNVSSWNDIHNAAQPGRIVFLTDSAGHPRYRRTTVRGLVSWAPHWTICCVAADDDDDATGKTGATASARDILGPAGVGVDLSRAHLQLCLNLSLPLVVVITKLDLASKTGLRQTLTKVLSIIKSTGRQPVIMSNSPVGDQDLQLQSLPRSDEDEVKKTLSVLEKREMSSIVPIVFTSAVTGSGIGKMHALLRHLPLPRVCENLESSSYKSPSTPSGIRTVFQIDEVFTMPDAQARSSSGGQASSHGSILSGHLQQGVLSIGKELLLGPFASDNTEDSEPDRANSFPGQNRLYIQKAAAMSTFQRASSGDFNIAVSRNENASHGFPEWQKVRVVSIRNLRLPVGELVADQVGTVGIVFQAFNSIAKNLVLLNAYRIRKGMVLISVWNGFKVQPPSSCCGFVASFDESKAFSLFTGSLVIIYIASIRASAKVVTVKRIAGQVPSDELFSFDDSDSETSGAELPQSSNGPKQVELRIHFVSSREWIEVGSQVLVMHGGGPGSSVSLDGGDKGSVGLDGLVGRITQIVT